jgi:Flp pilus assembly protein TadD
MVALPVAERLASGEKPHSWSSQVRLHEEKANRLANAGMLPEALNEDAAALELAPDDAYVLNNFGAALARVGRKTEALSAFERAAGLNPKNPVILRNLAFVHAELGDIKRALDILGSLDHPILQSARRAVLDLQLRRLAKRGVISWSGGKPDVPKEKLELTPGPSLSEWIIESRR